MSVDAAPRTRAAIVAVCGNPNTGKSTLFNAMTGSTQQTGNYPGVTVERRRGRCGDLLLVDLPGTYSLAPVSRDERIVVDVLSGRVEGEPRPDVALVVVDAGNLRRNLYLATQISETGLPVVVALNMIDEAEERGVKIDVALLRERLGVPVVATVATKGKGIDELKSALCEALDRPRRLPPVPWPAAVRESLAALAAEGRSEAEACRLLFDVDPPSAPPAGVDAARERLKAAGIDVVSAESTLRYAHLAERLQGVAGPADPAKSARGYAWDRLLTHRVWGLLIFAALMFGMFSSIYWIAAPLMEGIDALFGWLGGAAAGLLEGRPMLQSLVENGLVAGVGSVVIFLPQILILFGLIAILEDSGYMSRAAFLMDKLFAWTGLSGKSFVPMLSSFACAIPGVMSTRTIDDPKARLSTILIAPLMSCSARLPVYALLIGVFVEPRYGALAAGAAFFAMHVLGLAVAVPIAWLINRFLLKLRSIPFVLEMPPYRRPSARTVLRRVWASGREFVVRAGTVIFAFSIVIWALCYFPRPVEVAERTAKQAEAEKWDEKHAEGVLEAAYLEQSWMGRMGKAAQPVFAPAGFDWKITVAVLAAFPARELINATLAIVYGLGDDEDALTETLPKEKRADGSPVYTLPVAAAIMVFIAFCLQCGSTVAVMAREAGWRWAGFAFAYMTALAWVGAVATYQIGTALAS